MKPPEPPLPPLPQAALLTPVARLAASRQQLQRALHPATPPSWAARAQAACQPSLQRHPVAWVVGALVVGGLGAALWRHMPKAWLAKLKHTLTTTLGTVGQEALLAWWLSTLQAAQPPASSEAGPPTESPGPT